MKDPSWLSFLSLFEMFVTSFVPLPEEMGRDPYVFALISEGDDGDTAETVDGTSVVAPTTVELSEFAISLKFFSLYSACRCCSFFRCGWINTMFVWWVMICSFCPLYNFYVSEISCSSVFILLFSCPLSSVLFVVYSFEDMLSLAEFSRVHMMSPCRIILSSPL